MGLLFFKQDDLQYRDLTKLQPKLTDPADLELLRKKDKIRVASHIDRIKEKRKELLVKEEKDAQIRQKQERIMQKRILQLSQNEKELKAIEEQLRKEDEELRKKKEQEEGEEGLSVRTTIRKNKSMADLKNVKAKIENLSVVAPRSKAYFEAHSKVRKLKDIMELSDQAKNIMKAKQLKEMELIISTEINIKVACGLTAENSRGVHEEHEGQNRICEGSAG